MGSVFTEYTLMWSLVLNKSVLMLFSCMALISGSYLHKFQCLPVWLHFEQFPLEGSVRLHNGVILSKYPVCQLLLNFALLKKALTRLLAVSLKLLLFFFTSCFLSFEYCIEMNN